MSQAREQCGIKHHDVEYRTLVSECACVLLFLITAGSVSGYLFSVPALYWIFPDGPATNLLTALTVGCCAVSILCFLHDKRRLMAYFLMLSSLVLIFKLLSYYTHLTVVLDLDREITLFHQRYGDHKTNQMGINTVWMMVLLTSSLWFSFYRRHLFAQALAMLSFIIPSISIVGYVFNLNSFYGQMSLNTIICGVFLIFVTLSINAKYGLIHALLATTVSGRLARVQCFSGIVFALGLSIMVVRWRNDIDINVLLPVIIISLFWFLLLQAFSSAMVFSKIEAKRQTMEKKLIHAAQYDPLTGLYNRMAFSDESHKAIQRQSRDGGNICVLLIDIDFFKNINDTYGHDVGDKVLRCVASTINRTVRNTDIVGRFGGEEFSLLLPNTTWEEGLHVAEKIRIRVAQLGLSSVVGKKEKVSVSIGCSTIDINHPSLDESLKWADLALYDSKNSGRNQVQGEMGLTTLRSRAKRYSNC
ncbi:GGDEF domain-containing protein [Vibrio nitrifigilis]|uniref:diguanylate cyclase n=1 Tax=Vibrio nitrifigilis TaxID=2789781 RepID=A0ABS0GL91_9VIBR|nr:GGDEF domain-containing protein [Vibrio nitrifigilis]MBF9003102.1 GGDEF domain-containing protein [Vibrio nitrifigilis]